jgi:hypothetical protein
MNITLTLTVDDVTRILEQSYTFRDSVAQTLASAQTELARKTNPTEEQLMENLIYFVKFNVRPDNKISMIKFVRQYAQDHEKLMPNKFDELYSLYGAKTFVEQYMNGVVW